MIHLQRVALKIYLSGHNCNQETWASNLTEAKLVPGTWQLLTKYVLTECAPGKMLT